MSEYDSDSDSNSALPIKKIESINSYFKRLASLDSSDVTWGLKNAVHKSIGLSQIEDDKCVEFGWIIKNFSKISSSRFNSPEFDGGELSKYKWYLSIKSTNIVDDVEWVSLYLNIVNDQIVGMNEMIEVQFILYINEIPVEKGSYDKQLSGFTGSGYPKFIKKPSTIPNDEIKIECKITIKNTKFIHKIIESKCLYKNEGNFEKLQSDYRKILQRNEHSDFEILVHDESFKVHKAILSARSRVFSAMFSSQMQECQKSSVKIEDFNLSVVENMLEFIYTGKTVILKSTVQELLKISDKYDLPDLKSDCENYLIDYLLNKENCVLLLELADTFNAPKLKSEAIDFIIKFKAQVSETPLFQKMLKSKSSIGVDILMAEWKFLQCNKGDQVEENEPQLAYRMSR